MGKRKELEPMPKGGRIVIAVFALVLVALVLISGKFYLPNWRGNAVFLPVVLLIGLLLIIAVLVRLFKKS